jgi:hypothetical protein
MRIESGVLQGGPKRAEGAEASNVLASDAGKETAPKRARSRRVEAAPSSSTTAPATTHLPQQVEHFLPIKGNLKVGFPQTPFLTFFLYTFALD